MITILWQSQLSLTWPRGPGFLCSIKDHIAGNLSIDTEDFEYAPFSQEGGIGKAYQLFGEESNETLSELNERLVA